MANLRCLQKLFAILTMLFASFGQLKHSTGKLSWRKRADSLSQCCPSFGESIKSSKTSLKAKFNSTTDSSHLIKLSNSCSVRLQKVVLALKSLSKTTWLKNGCRIICRSIAEVLLLQVGFVEKPFEVQNCFEGLEKVRGGGGFDSFAHGQRVIGVF